MFTQIEFDAMPKYQDTKRYWFYLVTADKVQVWLKRTWNVAGECVTELRIAEDKLVVTDTDLKLFNEMELTIDDMLSDWDLYKQRPEYYVISKEVKLDMVDEYEWKLVGSILIQEFIRKYDDPDNMWKKIDRCLSWLRTTDFYTCPASTQYHDACHSGLLNHSLKVMSGAVELQNCPKFHSAHLEDAVFVAAVHDWCKIGLYIPYKKNVKDEVTDQWIQVDAYKYATDRTICLGHGVSSLYLVLKFFNISIEVASAIRWHMSRWNCVDSEVNELQQANRQFPLVHLIQFADQLSIVEY